MGQFEQCLQTLNQVVRHIEEYFDIPGAVSDWQLLGKYIIEHTKNIDSIDVLEILKFLKQLAPLSIAKNLSTESQLLDIPDVDLPVEDIALNTELHWQYNIARKILVRVQHSAEAKDVSAALKSVQQILEQVVKLRERITNVDKVQEFMAAVLQVLNEADPAITQQVLDRFEGLGGSEFTAIEQSTNAGLDLREGCKL
jgi:hypothetical protein